MTNVSIPLGLPTPFRGEWEPDVDYATGAVITHAGALYQATADHHSPGSFTATNWAQILAPPASENSSTDFGAAGDCRRVTDAATTAASKTLTSATAGFSSADVGKKVGVVGAGLNARTHVTTIESVTSGTQATMVAAAVSTASGQFAAIGTDDTAALQAAIDTLYNAGGGTLVIEGRCLITASLTPKSNVSVRGHGIGDSSIIPVGHSGLCAFREVTVTAVGNELRNVTWADFEVDGRGQADETGGYNVGTKGFFIEYLANCHFHRLWVHHTPASGIGTDFLIEGCTIIGCHINNCGRQANGNGLGGTGIGIGTGEYQYEDLTVMGCEITGCGNRGIFFERQRDKNFASRGMRIMGCVVRGNTLSGIGDHGVTGMIVSGCQMHANGVGFAGKAAGVEQLGFPVDGIVTGCDIAYNTDQGLEAGLGSGGYQFVNNNIHDNGGIGLQFFALDGTVVPKHVRIAGNNVLRNGGGGIEQRGSGSHQYITIQNNDVVDNGVTGTPAPGIAVKGPSNFMRIQGNRVTDTRAGGSKTQSYALQCSGGAFQMQQAVIVDNDFRNNATGTIDFGSFDTTGILNTRNPT